MTDNPKKSSICDMFRLGKMTINSVFSKPETIMYPLESKPAVSGLKGHVAIDIDKCIFCGICDKKCPASAIEVSKPEKTWQIDFFKCVQCVACVYECPKDCLIMETARPKVATSKGVFLVKGAEEAV